MSIRVTVKTQSCAAGPHLGSMNGTWHPQHSHVRHILRRSSVQPRLTVGAPNDKYEQEADRVADQVMRMAELSGVEPTPSDPKIQLQPKGVSERADSALAPETQERITAVRQGGAPLPEHTRHFFESRLGQDFSGVRLHTDSGAADSARSMNARAYTLGRDIVFASGQYGPDTWLGKHLLAHEPTHVVQQNGGQNVARR